MANSFGTETPPAPGPDGSNALMSGGMGASSAPPAAAPGQPAQPGQQPPPAPPTHAQTMAALRHFGAVRKELDIVMADPALGKSSVKKKIIDGVTRLVAERYITPAAAVDQLAGVPQEPLMQLKWIKGMMAQAKQAENGILDHYGAGNPNMGTVQDHFAATKGLSPMDEHQDHMAAMAANYGGGKR